MKLQHHTLFVFMILFSISKSAFSQSTQEELLGNWALDFNTSINHMDVTSKSHYDHMKIRQKQRFNATNKNKQLLLKADNNFLLKLGSEREVSGHWVFDTNNKNIVLTSAKGNVQNYKIKTFSGNTLVLKVNNTSSANMILQELYFIKQ